MVTKTIFMRFTLIAIFFSTYVLFAQNLDYNNGYESVRICTAIQGNNFVSEKSADEALTKILSVIGASKRFVLQECSNINNAVALTFNGVRYIMYDPEFMSELKDSSDWTNMYILAHEVGHHINGHSVDVILSSNGMGEETSLSTKRIQELEADEFAGFVLGRLGATLSQTQSVMKTISSDGDDSYSTHPSRSKRLSAIKRGFENSGGYVDSSNLDINKGKTVDSPYSNSSFSNVSYRVLNNYYNNAVYEGFVSNTSGQPLGYGTLFRNDGNKYEGEFSGGKRNGYGKNTSINGQTYEGFFVNNNPNGEGVLVLSSGEKRTGFFSEGIFVRGTIITPNGDKYEGIFNNNKFINSTLTKPNGEVIKLGFLDGSKGNGYSEYHTEFFTIKGFFKNGSLVPQIGCGYVGVGYDGRLIYPGREGVKNHKKKKVSEVGDFIPDLKYFDSFIPGNYFGKNEFSIGELNVKNTTIKYKGWFFADNSYEYAGYGELTLSDGSFYKGMFWDDKYNGYGILTKSDGTILKGLFKNGEFVKNEDFDFEWMQRTMKKW